MLDRYLDNTAVLEINEYQNSECDQGTYLTILLVFASLFWWGWFWSFRYLIRSRKVTKILNFFLKRKQKEAAERIKFEEQSVSDRSISEKTFHEFFKINTDFRENFKKDPEIGITYAYPHITITKYNLTIDEYRNKWINKPDKDNNPFRKDKATKFEINNWINNNHIYNQNEYSNRTSNYTLTTESKARLNTREEIK